MARYSFALPDPDKGWNLRQGKRISNHGAEPKEIAEKRTDVVVGVPASLGTTFAVRLPTIDSSLFDDMVVAQIEKRGLGHGEETVFDYEIVSQDSGHDTLLSVNVLSRELPDTMCLANAAGYAPSAAVWEMPRDGLFLWKEHRRLVLAARSDGHLTHVQALSAAPKLSAAAAQEINLSSLSLLADGLIDDNSALTVAGDFSGDEPEAFESTLKLPCRFEDEPVLAKRFSPGTRYLPQEVTHARARKKAFRLWSMIGLVTVVAYVVTGFFIWKKSESTRAEVASLEAQLKIVQPEVDQIRNSELRWETLQPAFDLHYFPVVQLNEVTKALPGSGVLIREFRTSGTTIRIQGMARDVQLAFNFENDLKANEAFANYEWNMPRPRVEQNNTANFEIEGKPKSLSDPAE